MLMKACECTCKRCSIPSVKRFKSVNHSTLVSKKGSQDKLLDQPPGIHQNLRPIGAYAARSVKLRSARGPSRATPDSKDNRGITDGIRSTRSETGRGNCLADAQSTPRAQCAQLDPGVRVARLPRPAWL